MKISRYTVNVLMLLLFLSPIQLKSSNLFSSKSFALKESKSIIQDDAKSIATNDAKSIIISIAINTPNRLSLSTDSCNDRYLLLFVSVMR